MTTIALAAAEAPLVVALDAGTSSVRALAYDLAGNAVIGSEEQIPYSLETTADGGATYPAEALFTLTTQVIDGLVHRLGDRAGDVAAVGMSSFWHALLGLDGDGSPTTPVLFWADTRAAGAARELGAILDPDAVLQRTGCRLHPSYWPAKLRWLHASNPEAAARTRRWLSFAEYALGRLSGPDAGAATYCMASGTGLLDVHSLAWDPEILAVSHVASNQLSPLVDLGPPGLLRQEFARRWPALGGAEWFPALGDGACANVGSGAIGSSRIALTVGTSAAMRVILSRPLGTPWPVPSALWAYRLDSERAVLGGALSNGGNLLRWMLDTTGCGAEDEALAAAFALAPDTTGLTFLPFLAGERAPGWHEDATGVLAGLTLATRPTALIRAALEAVPYRLAAVYDALLPLVADDHQIVVNGGAILNRPPWIQLNADVLGHPLTALSSDDESTARGAALMAAFAAGLIDSLADVPDIAADGTVYHPDLSHYSRYRAGRERQSRLERALVETGELG